MVCVRRAQLEFAVTGMGTPLQAMARATPHPLDCGCRLRATCIVVGDDVGLRAEIKMGAFR